MKYIAIVVFFIFAITKVEAFDNKVTHISITDKAAKANNTLQNYLLQNLGLKDKLETIIPHNSGKKIIEWLNYGSDVEDEPNCRAANHFHNPLLPWDQSQSTDVWPQDVICRAAGWTPRYSNITWATGLKSTTDTPLPRNKQDMGWDNARFYFYNALISSDITTRESLFAKTFQALGQSLHLLQDMAVPAHVRNDFLSHLIYDKMNPGGISKWFLNPFETFVKNNDDQLFSIIADAPTYPITKAFVSDFWDTDSRPDTPLQGLAESSNAGYFSDFTIPGNPHIPFFSSHAFLEPQIPTYTCSDTIPGTNDRRKYVSREACPTDGSPVKHLAAISSLTPRLLGMRPLPFINKYALDDNVHNTYARELLPRAVGYSAALLDYFFRGTLDATAAPGDITFSSVKVTVSNSTPNETMTTGDVSLVIRYKTLTETDLGGGKYKLNYPSADYTYKVVTLPDKVDLSTPQTLTFDFGDAPLPMNFSDMTMQLVFKGKLGNEDNSVALSELKPIDAIYTDFDLSLPQSGVYAKTSDDAPTSTFSELRVTALSEIPGGLSGGTISLALEYRTAVGNQFQSVRVDTEPVDAAGYILKKPEKNGVNTLPQGVPVELAFDLSSLQLPVQATDVELNVVYTNADGSQAIGVRDISEPTPVDVYNNTDYSCLNGTWYKYDDPAAMAIVDSNSNGIADRSDIYPHTINDISFLSGPAGEGTLDASVASTLFASGPLATGQKLRMGYILTDYENRYAVNESRTGQIGDPWFHPTTNNRIFPGTGFRNDATSWSSMFTFRDVDTKLWWGASVIFINKEYNGTCTWDALNQKLGL